MPVVVMDDPLASQLLPQPGSEWLAADGRRVRLGTWTKPTTYPQDDLWVSCAVLNPAKGQRRQTSFTLARFTGATPFLRPAS